MNGTVVNCLVKCKVHRPLKITDRSNQSMEKTKDKKRLLNRKYRFVIVVFLYVKPSFVFLEKRLFWRPYIAV